MAFAHRSRQRGGIARSISRDETFAEDLRSDADLDLELLALVTRAASDLRQAGQYHLPHFRGREPLMLAQGKRHVLANGHAVKERRVLKHEAEPDAFAS